VGVGLCNTMMQAESFSSMADLARSMAMANQGNAADVEPPCSSNSIPSVSSSMLPHPLAFLGTVCKRTIGQALGDAVAGVSGLVSRSAESASGAAAPRGGAIKGAREAKMITLIQAKLGPDLCARDDAPAVDAGVRAWRAFAKRVRQPSPAAIAEKRKLARRLARTPVNSPAVGAKPSSQLQTPHHHAVLNKKHQLYSKYLPEFTMLTLEELNALGPIPAWEAPFGEWREWARLVRSSLDKWVGEESLFRIRAGEAELAGGDGANKGANKLFVTW
jgi:hypothetical protein